VEIAAKGEWRSANTARMERRTLGYFRGSVFRSTSPEF